MDVSVIIVNYNTLELTKNAIESLIEKTIGISYEIILVDNDSTDGSKELFSNDFYKSKIKFLRSEKNLGFGKANNLGIDIAKGKYLFLLNSDTLLINNAIKILYDFMEKNLDVGVAGGNLYNENLEPTNSYSLKLRGEWVTVNGMLNFIKRKIKYFYLNKIRKKRLEYGFNYTELPLEVETIVGADMFIRKSVLDKTGVFDPEFFMYHEESELSYRILKNGFKIMSVPKAKIIHLEGKSSKFKMTKFSMEKNGDYLFFKKVYGIKYMKRLYYILQLMYMFFPSSMNRAKSQINKKEYLKIIKNGDKL